MKAIGERTALAMSLSCRRCFAEDHGHHLQHEAVYEAEFTLRPYDGLVKGKQTLLVEGRLGPPVQSG